ncbi:ABC transporter permease [Legionella micdadei]|uniref:Peptide ABC transporter, permease protein n=1 Tax=Legionella micdadei TaxID=451 RepID=A0A098GFT1_LEGMI|nr:ABC transporter permease [Legionella micdadei]ARG97213.1 peptide ABC transporter permease [Legionella micdadei]ARH00529.1 peptide ABC transporter permease [Legionella micdadei]KTD29180.1 peptide ABC transporter permease [Legionella micdadei]NSL17446.1 ABC transporter permease [Legionella micdadei]CEG61334.1 Peptide ABC transporter, permease protein [Legionella micdadei]
MELLWTDQCFLAVLLISLTISLISLRKRHVRRAFQRIFHRPLAVSAGIVLFFFLAIGIMDSIHLTSMVIDENVELSAIQNNSILDRILTPLGSTYEKTYSAPLALNLYSSETVLVNGTAQQVYPRLKYPATIKNEAIKHQFIQHNVFLAFLLSLFVVGILWSAIVIVKWLMTQKMEFAVTTSGLSALITLFICLFVIFASYWISRDLHLLGTGKIGQDIFYYTVKSIRTGLIIGILTTLFMLPLALLLGISAGYFGGWIDDIIQYIYITLSSIPGVLLITASVLSMQTYIANHPQQFSTLSKSADARLLALCLILGVTSWTSLCRLLRAETLKLREIDYVLAARALGSSSLTILRKHLLPNVMHIILITLVLDFSFLVLAEAVLSYVGVGVSPMTISWGNMINGARLELARDPIVWWPMLSAFACMFILVLASNLFADAVRDAFDPHQSTG